MADGFVGDGSAPGDGGALLQKLYEKFPWRPVNGKPGNWSMKRVGDGMPPEALVSTCGISSFVPERLEGNIVVIEFADGGGLWTLVKADGTFTHTLLTRSAQCLHFTRVQADAPTRRNDDAQSLLILYIQL